MADRLDWLPKIIPIGAKWEGDDNQRKYWIELHEGNIWWAGWCYIDNSGGSSDWFSNRQAARDYLYFNGRMKRVK
jgi:hypothetical protein